MYFCAAIVCRFILPQTVGVASLQQSLNPNIGLKVAGAFVAAVPMIIVFIAFQKYFITGATDGAVKE